MSQRDAHSDDPATQRFYDEQAARETEQSEPPEGDEYPAHWNPRPRLAEDLAALSEDELLTTINAALSQRRGR